MSIFSFVEPIESVVPVAEDALSMAALTLRTIGSLGAMAAMFMLFRPLLTGAWHALLMAVKPRPTLTQRAARYQSKRERNSFVSSGSIPEVMLKVTPENSISQPNLASELRHTDSAK